MTFREKGARQAVSWPVLVSLGPNFWRVRRALHLVKVCQVEYWIWDDVEQVVDHPRQQSFQQVIRFFQARIRVDFDQNGVEKLIDNKVKA